MCVGWEDGIPDTDDDAVVDDHREPSQQCLTRRVEGRQSQRGGEPQVDVGEQRVRQVKPFRCLTLIGGVLG